jgi:quercetin dioxygenase-like cupin family protein
MKFLLLVASPAFSEGLAFFHDELGFTIEKISPAENPSLAELSGHGLTICLDKNADVGPVSLSVITEDTDLIGTTKIGPNGTRIIFSSKGSDVKLPISKDPVLAFDGADSAQWTPGRAGMLYRNLLPAGSWNYVASHIKIPGSGVVPDWVHYHDASFQIIYCYKGAAKLVYEDQGAPFVFSAGDCVLQPPLIRHRVLESYDDLEVIEVVTPLNHSTFTDHMMDLPTGQLEPERSFSGQRFIWDQSATRSWDTANGFSTSSLQVSKTGIGEASAHQGGVRILRPAGTPAMKESFAPFSKDPEADFILWFILTGTADLHDQSGESTRSVNGGDAIVSINTSLGLVGTSFRNYSDDFTILEVQLPMETND